MSTIVYIIRHGETDWNRQNIFRGHADIPLNDNGLKQACAVSRGLAHVKFDAVYSSPLSRALETARAIAENGNVPVKINSAFIDIDYGKWQGMSLDEVKVKYREEYGNWLRNPHRAEISNGESLEEINKRAWGAISEAVSGHRGEVIAVTAHRVINKVLVLAILGLPLNDFWRIRQDNCCINVFEFKENEIIVHRINDTCHLRDVDVLDSDF